MNAPTKARDFLDPLKEAKAVASLRESISDLADDDELLLSTIEGETSLLEAVDLVLGQIRDAEVLVEGVKAVSAKLGERKSRAEATIKRARALLEQAMCIADVEKIVRPTATLTLSARAPSVSVTEESDIPARFWVPGDPKLDARALAEAVKAHAAALAIEDPVERAAALAEAPAIPGATLTNGAPSISIRVK